MKKAARQTPRNLLVLGDFNIPVNEKNRNFEFYNLIKFSRLKQHVLEPTHGDNTLDLVFTYCCENLTVAEVKTSDRTEINSDHHPVEFELTFPANTTEGNDHFKRK